jgi:hypothetical protein
MSVKQRLVVEDEEDGRKGYLLHSGDNGPEPESVNLGVWDDRYNVEWKTEVDLAAFHDLLEGVEGISPETSVTAYLSGPEGLETVEMEYQELTDHLPAEEVGNIHYSDPSFELIWEDTPGPNTVELTQYRRGEDIFEDVYRDTALVSGPQTEQIKARLDRTLDW